MGIFTSILILSFLIFFHELGHFLVARYFGVRVYVFSIGFGKEIFKREYNGVTYQLAMIPLGGYVKMKGQDDSDPSLLSKDDDSYNMKTPLQRIGILFAGPFANFLLAFLIYIILAFNGTKELSSVIGTIKDGSPAQFSGMMIGDKVVKINDTEIKLWKDLGDAITKSQGSIKVYIERNNRYKILNIKPKNLTVKNIFGEVEIRRMIGVAPNGDIITVQHSIIDSIDYALNKTYDATFMIFQGIKKMIEGVVPSSEVGGVISIVKVTSQASEIGIMALLSLMALISVNLAVLNLLPIPALDGGHIMFNIYELITKKAPNEKILYQMTIAGWIILLSLMLLGVYNDINRIIE